MTPVGVGLSTDDAHAHIIQTVPSITGLQRLAKLQAQLLARLNCFTGTEIAWRKIAISKL